MHSRPDARAMVLLLKRTLLIDFSAALYPLPALLELESSYRSHRGVVKAHGWLRWVRLRGLREDDEGKYGSGVDNAGCADSAALEGFEGVHVGLFVVGNEPARSLRRCYRPGLLREDSIGALK